MNRFLYFLVLCASSMMCAQSIDGNWMRVAPLDTHYIPENVILSIKNNQLHTFSFDSLLYTQKLRYNIKKGTWKQGKGSDDSPVIRFELSKDHRTLVCYHSAFKVENDKEVSYVFKNTLVRLLKTELKDSVKNTTDKTYQHIYAKSLLNPYANIQFKNSKKIKELTDQKSFLPHFRLEKIRETYFISYFASYNHRRWMVPIKEINKDYLIVYGIPEKPGFLKLHRSKPIKTVSDMYISE